MTRTRHIGGNEFDMERVSNIRQTMQLARTQTAAMFAVLAAACGLSGANAATSDHPSLSPQPPIELPGVKGRIDHLSVDLERRLLFVAELGNGSVDVIDVDTRSATQRFEKLQEPQGLAYSTHTHTLFVATGGDGVLHTYSGAHLTPGKSVAIGSDADNVRIDDASDRVYVAYDEGIAVLNATNLAVIARVKLKAHPESFQVQSNTHRMFVNIPEAKEIAVVDLSSLKQVDSWSTGALSSNFAMALDVSRQIVFAAFRRPSRLAIYPIHGGHLLQSLGLCDDSDDVFVDEKRARLYASCGEGFVDVFNLDRQVRTDHIATRPGARTSLYVPEWNRLFVAARATADRPATILVYDVGD